MILNQCRKIIQLTIRCKNFLFVSFISCVNWIISSRQLFLCFFSVYRNSNFSFLIITGTTEVFKRWKRRITKIIRISRKHHMISQSRDIWYIIWQDFHLIWNLLLWPTHAIRVFSTHTPFLINFSCFRYKIEVLSSQQLQVDLLHRPKNCNLWEF